MVLKTQPPNFKWFRIILVMSLRLFGTADLARPSNHLPISNRVTDSISRLVLFRVFSPSSPLILSHKTLAVWVGEPSLLVCHIMTAVLAIVTCNVNFCAFFALIQMTVTHLRMAVKLIQRQLSLTFETRLHKIKKGWNYRRPQRAVSPFPRSHPKGLPSLPLPCLSIRVLPRRVR